MSDSENVSISSGNEWQPGEKDDSEAEGDGQEEEEVDIAEAEDDEADAEELKDDFFGARLDPFALLENMGAQDQGQDQHGGFQPYEILAKQARQARQKVKPPGQSKKKRAADDSSEEEAALKPKNKKAKGTFGATVEDIWDEDLAAQLGFGTAKSRKKQRDRLRRRRRAQRAGKTTRNLPEEVTKKLGEANLLYATGKYTEAIPLLKEVVKFAPSLSDPYHTLGLIYEALNDNRVALDFLMIAAHLTPKDAALWKRLANLSREMGFIRQAIYCLSKVIARDRGDVDARWDRAMMYTQIDEYRKAVLAFEQIQNYRQGDGEVPLMLARLYHQLQQPEKACEALEKHIESFPLAIQPTHINILAELYMEGKDYQKAADLIDRTSQLVNSETGPLIDLQTKLSICYIHLGRLKDARPGLESLLREAHDGLFDLCLDAADALLQNNHSSEALKLFSIVNSTTGGNAELWTKMLQCYNQTGSFQEGAQEFSSILTDDRLADDERREASLALAEMLAKLGKSRETLQVLESLEDVGPLPVDAQTRKAKVLLELDAADDYLAVMLPIIQEGLKHAQGAKAPAAKGGDIRTKQRKALIARKKKLAANDGIFKGYVTQDRRKQQRREADERLANAMDSTSDEEGAQEDTQAAADGGRITEFGRNAAEFQSIVQTGQVLLDSGKPDEAEKLLSDCLLTFGRRWQSSEKKEKIRLLAGVAALQAREPAIALSHVRHTLSAWPFVNTPWNVFCKAGIQQNSLRNVQKLLQIMSQSLTRCLPLRLTLGHCHLMNGHFGSALDEYLAAYSLQPESELTLLCIGITYLNQCLSRKVPNRDKAVLAAFSFLQRYAKLRTNKQEAFYNLGRAAHQVNLVHLAVMWYQQALSAGPAEPLATMGNPKNSSGSDLTATIAFNLVHIYRSSGADNLARQIMRKYLTI